jgi:nicotinamide riboside kinase
VSISGTLLSGKTTLVSELRNELSTHAAHVSDIPRLALQSLERRIVDADLEGFQYYVAFAQLLAEDALCHAPIKLLDKSLLDALAYWRTLVSDRSPAWADAITADRYAVVFICDPADIPSTSSDPIQIPHLEQRNAIQGTIVSLAEQLNVDRVAVSGPVEHRATTVMRELRRRQLLPS